MKTGSKVMNDLKQNLTKLFEMRFDSDKQWNDKEFIEKLFEFIEHEKTLAIDQAIQSEREKVLKIIEGKRLSDQLDRSCCPYCYSSKAKITNQALADISNEIKK